MCKHERYFRTALIISKKSDHPYYRLGAVVVKHNAIISFGFNHLRSHPRSLHDFKMTHAELHAILGVPAYKLRGADLYVFRETKGGRNAMAKPCSSCQKMLDQCGIKNVYYTTPGGFNKMKFS